MAIVCTTAKKAGRRSDSTKITIEGHEVDFLPIEPLVLAQLAAQLANARLIGLPSTLGVPKDARQVIAEAHDFLCLCGDVLSVREQAIGRQIEHAKTWTELEKLRAAYGDKTPIPMQQVLKFLGIDRIKLRSDELAVIGVKRAWEGLSNDEKAGAVFRYLTRESVIWEGENKAPMTDGRVLRSTGRRTSFGSAESRRKNSLHGLCVNELLIVGEALVEAKRQRDCRLKSEAGKASHKKPQRRSAHGKFAKVKRKATGEFAKQSTD